MTNITIPWQRKYFRLAKTVSNFSKDPSRKVGAVAIGNHGQVLSQGYNGFPRKFSDKEEFYSNKLIKNNFIIHAEMNCIYNAALTGVSLDRALLFVYGLHICHECAKGIIQAGFSEVYSKGPVVYSKKFTITATEADDTYYVEVGSSTTASYTPGDYVWEAYITRSSDSERIMVDSGRTEITINLANTNADLRSHAKKVLDAIEAVIENRATIDQSSMSIAGRSLSRMNIDELMNFRMQYKTEYLKEIKLARIRNKQGSGNTVKVSFGSTSTVNPTSYT